MKGADSSTGDSDVDEAAERLAALDDVLGGHPSAGPPDDDDFAGRPGDTPRVGPSEVDLLLLLNQAGAEHRDTLQRPGRAARTRVGRFTLLREVGRGGFATVHEAVDARLHRRVALKIAHAEPALAPRLHRRFMREAELAARVVHPHVVTIHEVGEDEGVVFIAAEFCDGGSLEGWLQSRPGPVAPRTAAAVVRALAEGLHTAHGCGVIHRDIKPANVLLATATSVPLLVDAEGRGFAVKLGDFGLGKLADEAVDGGQVTPLSRAGDRVGTLAWMAPEQADRTRGPVGPHTDIYALGLLLDRMLTGRCRQEAEGEAETLRLILMEEAVSPDRVVGAVPADLAAVCLKCLAKDPRERYNSAAEFAVDLSRFLEGRPTAARPVTVFSRLVKAARRQPLLSGSLVAACLAVLVGVFLWLDGVGKQAEIERRNTDLVRHEAAGELRLGFDALRNGSVAGALERLRACRSIDPTLTDSLAGRWLVARLHGERRSLLDVAAVRPDANAASPRGIHVIAVSSDGALLAAGRADGTLSLARRSESSGEPSWLHLPAHDEINDVAFSPDGVRVVTAGQDGAVHVWSTVNGSLLASPAAGEKPLYAAAFSPDGTRLAWGGEARTITVADPAKPSSPRVLAPFDADASTTPPPDGEIEEIVWLDDDRFVASCGKRVAIVRAADGGIEREFKGLSGVVGSLDLSPDRRLLLCAGTDVEPSLLDLESGRVVLTLPAHPNWIQGAIFSPDGRTVATGCKDGVIRRFEVATGALERTHVGHEGRLWDVRFLPDGTLLSAGGDGTLREWLATAPAACSGAVEIGLDAGTIADVAFRPGAAASSGASDGASDREALLLLKTGKPLVASIPTGPVSVAEGFDVVGGRQVGAEPHGPRMGVVASGRLFVFEHALAAAPTPVGERVSSFTWVADGRLLSGGWDGDLRVVDAGLARSAVVDQFTSSINCLELGGPAGDLLAAGAGEELRTYFLPESGPPVRRSREALVTQRVPGVRVMSIAWSPDASHLAYGTSIGTVHIVDAATGAPIGTFANHVSTVHSLRWSRDGRALISADEDAVRISDVATTAVLDELRPGWKIAAIDLAPNASGTGDAGLLVAGGARQESPTGRGEARLLWLDLGRRLAN